MEKNQIILRLLVAFLLLFSSAIWGEEEIVLIGGKYVDFDDLKKKVDILSYQLESPTMHGKLKGNTGFTLGFQVDKPFYSFKDLVEKTSHPVKLEFQKLLLPKEIVEAIFIYLVDNEVSYRFSGSSLYFSVYGKVFKKEISQFEDHLYKR